MVKIFLQKKKTQVVKKEEHTTNVKKLAPEKHIFLVYVQWSQENRVLKTYMRTGSLESECDMICNGLSDIIANPDMKLNNKNIKMAILYQLDDSHDISRDFDVIGIIPTRLDHYLNSEPDKRIDFSQEQIDEIVNKVEFTYRGKI